MHPLFRSAIASLAVVAGSILTATAAPGFFSVKEESGRWWLIDPEGNPFISKGVCHVTFQGDAIQRTGRSPYQEAVTAKYGEVARWRYPTAARLLDWGFNSLGAWSDSELRLPVGRRRPVAGGLADPRSGGRFCAAPTSGRGGLAPGIVS